MYVDKQGCAGNIWVKHVLRSRSVKLDWEGGGEGGGPRYLRRVHNLNFPFNIHILICEAFM